MELVRLGLVFSLESHSKYENCINRRLIRPFLKVAELSDNFLGFRLSEEYHKAVRLGQALLNIL